MIVWLDANDDSTTLKSDGNQCSSGDSIQTWKDKSGNGFHATNQYGDKPIKVTNVVNGKSVVRFTATSKFNGTQLKGRNGIGTSSVSIFIVYRYRDLHRVYSIDVVFSLGTEFDGACCNSQSVSGNVGTDSTLEKFSFHNPTFSGAAVQLNKWMLTSLTFDSMTLLTKGFQNGQLLGTKTGTSGSIPDKLILGSWDASWVKGNARPYPEYFADADIAEVIIYTQELSTANQYQVESYLNEKYSLSLPTATPTTVPTISPTRLPTYHQPTFQPTGKPTVQPTIQPSSHPTSQPTESAPPANVFPLMLAILPPVSTVIFVLLIIGLLRYYGYITSLKVRPTPAPINQFNTSTTIVVSNDDQPALLSVTHSFVFPLSPKSTDSAQAAAILISSGKYILAESERSDP